MPGSKAVKERIDELIGQAPELSAADRHGDQIAWLIAAEHAVKLACPSSGNPYHRRAQELVQIGQRASAQEAISATAALLTRLREEIEGGLLTTIENHAIAVTFDDFLDHGAEYLRHSRKNEAAVVAGIVFEDTIRRICRVLEIPENGVALDTLISELAKQDALTALKAKRARAAAGLRTSAAHARWEQIQLGDVNPVIEFTRELMAAHLG
jgi:hypothetical protein